MSFLENQTRPNSYKTYYITNPASNIIFQGNPPWEIHVVGQDLVATQLVGEIEGVSISVLSCNWSLYPVISNSITYNASNHLTVTGTTLFFNGDPIATTSNISNVADWSLYVALQNVNFCNFAISNISQVSAVGNFNVATGVGCNLTVNGSPLSFPPSNWYNYPALSNVDFSNHSISNINGVASTTNFNVATGAGCNLTVNGSPLSFPPSNWANYPAVTDVNMSNHSINYISNIYTDRTNSSWIATAPPGALNNVNISLVTDGTTNVGSAAPNRINLTAQNGYYGQINLTANSGLSNVSPLGGIVNIVANGGFANPGTSASYGGTINITANSGPLAEIYLTSKVVTTAASVLSYAGVITPPLSTDGYNFIYGTGGVNICAGAPAVIPNVIGTTYIYGTTGIELGSSVYIYNGIYPYSGSNLLISSRTGSLFNIEYVNTILMGSTVSGVLTGNGTISNCANFTMATTSGTDVGAITHLANINSLAISNYRTCNWANYAAASNININSKNLNSAGTLTFITTGATPGEIVNLTTINTVPLSNYLACNWASYAAGTNLNMNSNTISNVPTIVMSVGGAISNVSTINGAAYPPSGSGWVPIATSQLNMCNYGIINIGDLSNVSNINGSAISNYTTSNWSSYSALSNVIMGAFSNSFTTLGSNIVVGGGSLAYPSNVAAIQFYNSTGSLFANIQTNIIGLGTSSIYVNNSGGSVNRLWIQSATYGCNQIANIADIGTWSSYPATTNLNMSNFSISNCCNLTVSNVITTQFNGSNISNFTTSNWWQYAAGGTVNLVGYDIAQVGNINTTTINGLPSTGVPLQYDFWVSPTAAINGNGNIGFPFNSISNAIAGIYALYPSNVNPITIHLASGSYPGFTNSPAVGVYINQLFFTGVASTNPNPTVINGSILITEGTGTGSKAWSGGLSMLTINGTVDLASANPLGGTYSLLQVVVNAGPTSTGTQATFTNSAANGATQSVFIASSSFTAANAVTGVLTAINNIGMALYMSYNTIAQLGLGPCIYNTVSTGAITAQGSCDGEGMNCTNYNTSAGVQPIIWYNTTGTNAASNNWNKSSLIYTSGTLDTGTGKKCVIYYQNTSGQITTKMTYCSILCEGARTTNGIPTQYLCVQVVTPTSGATVRFTQSANYAGATANHFPNSTANFIKTTNVLVT